MTRAELRAVACVVGLALAPAAFASVFEAHVVGVMDGDTVRVLTRSHELIKIRLAEIDAPEKKQPFGARSKQELSDLIFDHDITVDAAGLDRYGRTIAHLRYRAINVNLEMVTRGMAWCYTQYLKDQSCVALQAEAKTAKRGLWHDQNPMAPWLWRHRPR